MEYHTVGEFPAAILCFANGELYEIVPIPQGKETMICQLLRQPQKDAGKRIVVVEDTAQIELLHIPQVAGFCTVAEDGTVSYYKRRPRLNPDVLFEPYPPGTARAHRHPQKAVRDGAFSACARSDAVCKNCRKRGTPQRKSTAHLRNMFFSVSNEPPIYYYPKAAEVQGIRVWADINYLRVLLPALLPDKKKRDGCKFLLLPLQAALVQSGPLPHFSDCVICVEHIYDHNLPIKAVRDYDNLEVESRHRCHCYVLPDGRHRGAVRFFPDDPVWIFVLYRDNGYAKNCFSAWLNAPKSAENRPPLFRKIRKNQIPVLENDFSASL